MTRTTGREFAPDNDSSTDQISTSDEGVEILTDEADDEIIEAGDDAVILTDGGEDLIETSHSLTRFKIDCLAAIERLGTPYGLAIKRALEGVTGEEVNHGRLYPNLDQLVESGLVEKSERDRRTNEYAITDKGGEILQRRVEWLSGGDDL